MDAEYDMMRSARDARFLYIRNFQPELPYAGHIIYRNQSAIMQEWLRLQAERRSERRRALWMRTSRPAEELFDVGADPHQIREPRARAGAPRHARADARGGRGLDGADRRPGADQRGRDDPAHVAGRRAARDRAALHRRPPDDRRARRAATRWRSTAPMEVVIYVPTQGASIGYTTEDGPTPRWRLYTGPIRVTAGMTLRAKAIRYGYKESDETRVVLTPKEPPPP